MPTITLQVNDNVYEKFQWLLSHFHKDEIDIMHPNKENIAKKTTRKNKKPPHE